MQLALWADNTEKESKDEAPGYGWVKRAINCIWEPRSRSRCKMLKTLISV